MKLLLSILGIGLKALLALGLLTNTQLATAESLSVKVNLEKTKSILSTLENAKAKLGSAEKLLSIYPKLKEAKELKKLTYSHEIEPLGTMGYSHTVKYLSSYSVI